MQADAGNETSQQGKKATERPFVVYCISHKCNQRNTLHNRLHFQQNHVICTRAKKETFDRRKQTKGLLLLCIRNGRQHENHDMNTLKKADERHAIVYSEQKTIRNAKKGTQRVSQSKACRCVFGIRNRSPDRRNQGNTPTEADQNKDYHCVFGSNERKTLKEANDSLSTAVVHSK